MRAPPLQRDLLEREHDEQRERSDRCGEDEDRLDGVDDVRARDRRRRARVAAGAGGEDGAEDGGPDRAAEGAEEVRRRHSDAQAPPVDAVLHGDDEDLADHPEAEAEDRERQPCRRP